MSSENKELRVIGQGRYLDVVDENGWEYVRRHGATGVVVIVATTDDRKLVLVEQPRVPVHRRTIELPAGLVGDQTESRAESLEAAAIRELQEETGFRAEHWNLLVEGPSAVGVSAEIVTFFRATGLTRVGPGGGDDSEDIVVHVIPLRDVPSFLSQKVAAGLLIDPKVFAALYFINTERPERSRAHAAAPPGQPFSLKLNEEQGPAAVRSARRQRRHGDLGVHRVARTLQSLRLSSRRRGDGVVGFGHGARGRRQGAR